MTAEKVRAGRPGPITFEPRASLALFGHEPVPARVAVFARPRGWRIRRAVIFAVTGIALAPLVALFPPHVPWALGALSAGFFLAWRSMKSRFAVARFEGNCPRCQAPLHIASGSRLRIPHPLSCQSCHYELVLNTDPTDLSNAPEGSIPTTRVRL